MVFFILYCHFILSKQGIFTINLIIVFHLIERNLKIDFISISIDQCTDAIPTDIMDQFYDHLRAGSDHNLKRDQKLQSSANR